jgi:uncharacterized protein (TIGR01777 family)
LFLDGFAPPVYNPAQIPRNCATNRVAECYKAAVTNVLVTGGTGFIGSGLVTALNRRGHFVTVMGRDVSRIQERFGGCVRAVGWDPLESGDWTQEVGRHSTIVHLAGEPAVGRRMTDGVRRAARHSRVRSTRRIVDAIGQADTKPATLICASAVGYYGTHTQGAPVDESAPVGTGFLAELCHEWEGAALRAELFGVRVVLLRFGIVLGENGGALARLLPLFKLGLGGRLGNGRQPMPWVALGDVTGVVEFCIDHSSLRGPVNVVSPNIVDNARFTHELANAVHRPALLGVPGFALRAALGEGADALLVGQNAPPAVLLREGYEFKYPDLNLALAAAVARAG